MVSRCDRGLAQTTTTTMATAVAPLARAVAAVGCHAAVRGWQQVPIKHRVRRRIARNQHRGERERYEAGVPVTVLSAGETRLVERWVPMKMWNEAMPTLRALAKWECVCDWRWYCAAGSTGRRFRVSLLLLLL